MPLVDQRLPCSVARLSPALLFISDQQTKLLILLVPPPLSCLFHPIWGDLHAFLHRFHSPFDSLDFGRRQRWARHLRLASDESKSKWDVIPAKRSSPWPCRPSSPRDTTANPYRSPSPPGDPTVADQLRLRPRWLLETKGSSSRPVWVSSWDTKPCARRPSRLSAPVPQPDARRASGNTFGPCPPTRWSIRPLRCWLGPSAISSVGRTTSWTNGNI